MVYININIIPTKKLFKFSDLNRRRKINYENNKLGEKLKKKRKNNIIKNFITDRSIILLIMIKSIIISNLFYITKSNIYDFNFFKDSIITLKIIGKGEKLIFNENFKGFLKEVHINGENQTGTPYKYDFNQEYNSVELILKDNIQSTENMFQNCNSITEINLSNFQTSSVKSMDNMFEDCSSLTSLDLSNLQTSSVKNMNFMFSGCSSLISLDFSNFDTSSVTRMDSMFSHCSSLTSLDLSYFNVSSLTSMDSMFYECNNLEYINLYNFNEIQLNPNIFEDSPINLIICINGITNITFNNENYTYYNKYNKTNFYAHNNVSYYNNIIYNCFTVDCSIDWKKKQMKLINNNKCIESCNDSEQYPFEYNGKCYDYCSKGLLSDNNNNEINTCKCELDKCLLCPQVALNKGLCTKCNDDYYPIENDASNLGEYFDCYKNPEGYYLDDNLYKKCYETCKTCDKEGNYTNHNCIICNSNTPYAIKKNDIINCYSSCDSYYYYNETNYFCTMNSSCPDAFPKLKQNSKECIFLLNLENINEGISQIDKNGIQNSIEKAIKYYDNILANIESIFTSENFDTSNIDKGNDEVLRTDKVTVTFTTAENQRNNIYKNVTKIDLGECEDLLRNAYNISRDTTLYMKKMDVVQEGTNAIKVEYDIYCKLSGDNLEKLNLKSCGETKITITIPYDINDHIDKLNASSGYYNDICYTTTSEDGTDISLQDRKSEFVNKDKIVCQEGCIFSEYDYDNHVAKCNCDVKESPLSILI